MKRKSCENKDTTFTTYFKTASTIFLDKYRKGLNYTYIEFNITAQYYDKLPLKFYTYFFGFVIDFDITEVGQDIGNAVYLGRIDICGLYMVPTL